MAFDVRQWTYLDETHPANDRPPEIEAWPYPSPGFQPAKYGEDEAGYATEDLQMASIGHPSQTLYQNSAEETIDEFRLNSQATSNADLSAIERDADQMLQVARAASMGPYSRKDLHQMGHPYGWGYPSELVSWGKLTRPRAIPAMGRHANLKGTRGRVANRDMLNFDPDVGATHLKDQWFIEVIPDREGVTIRLGNRAPYAWFLSHGTVKMQAHGPWSMITDRFLSQLQSDWRQVSRAAWRQRRTDAAMFGERWSSQPGNIVQQGGTGPWPTLPTPATF